MESDGKEAGSEEELGGGGDDEQADVRQAQDLYPLGLSRGFGSSRGQEMGVFDSSMSVCGDWEDGLSSCLASLSV